MITVQLTLDEASALQQLCDLELGTGEANRINVWRHVATASEKLQRAKDPTEILAEIADIVTSPNGFDPLEITDLLRARKIIK